MLDQTCTNVHVSVKKKEKQLQMTLEYSNWTEMSAWL